jgi:hypothetical protein
MDQIIGLTAASRRSTVGRVLDFVVAAVDGAPAFDAPFYHLMHFASPAGWHSGTSEHFVRTQ